MSDSTPSPSFRALARTAVLHGGAAGILWGLWMMGEYALGFMTTRPDIGRITMLIALIFPVGATIIGVMRWRDRELGGAIRFSQAFGTGLAIGAACAFAVVGLAWLHAATAPGVVDATIDLQGAQIRARGAPADEVDAWVATTKATANAFSYAAGRLAPSLVTNLVIALVAAISVRKNPLATCPR
jgi:hypothetical protein